MKKSKISDKVIEKLYGDLAKRRERLENKGKLIAAEKLIGKCFKLQDSFSDDEKWQVYYKVIGVSDYPGESRMVRFCKDSRNSVKVEIIEMTVIGRSYPGNEWQEITVEEFNDARDGIGNSVNDILYQERTPR